MATELARIAYEAYASEARPHLPWGCLPERTQERWRRAVRATLEAASGVADPFDPVEPGTAEGSERYG